MMQALLDSPRRVLIWLVRGYRLLLSPWLGSTCRFTPTCSAYSLEALDRHGAIRGTGLTVWRLLRCGPWCAGGHDPVPPAAVRSSLPEGGADGLPLSIPASGAVSDPPFVVEFPARPGPHP